ncbi:BTB/POZ domain-containing protein [Phthorimaea operculella]|nr:BTB/POZ domain-containing protein [Phthorimaea operculella]
MVQSQFSLSWETYKSSICNGFSSLQQNGEFVDMTLAADGHHVKVHQVLIAMVSPYLKELITSAPCQHPVIFLNNVSYQVLTSLLEYIYTGEVLIPSENLISFVATARALHIKGLEDLDNTTADAAYKVADNVNQTENSLQCRMTGIKRLAVPSEMGTEGQIGLPAAAKRVTVKLQKPGGQPSLTKSATKQEIIESDRDESDNNMYAETLDMSGMQNDSDEDYPMESLDTSEVVSGNKSAEQNKSSNLQFTVSIRGSLQVILNRYIYNLHSSATSGMRRWRCVDYRNNRCKAFVVTKDNVVLNRANLHNHSFHDKKILQKIEKKAVFTALDDLQEYKEKQHTSEKEMLSSLLDTAATKNT